MSTESFFNTYIINREDIDRFVEIMTTEPTFTFESNVVCEDVKGEEIFEFLGIEKKDV